MSSPRTEAGAAAILYAGIIILDEMREVDAPPGKPIEFELL